MLTFNFTPFPVLTTDRLILRSISHDDKPEMFFLRSDDEVMRYIDRPRAAVPDDVTPLIQKMLDAVAANEDISWAVCLRDDPKLIGYMGYWRIKKEHFRGEIGYAMHPSFQGKGLMSEAVRTVLDYGFNVLKFHSVEANVNPGNAASIRLLERNNFVREAYFKEDFYWNGKFLDSAIYSLLNPAG